MLAGVGWLWTGRGLDAEMCRRSGSLDQGEEGGYETPDPQLPWGILTAVWGKTLLVAAAAIRVKVKNFAYGCVDFFPLLPFLC